MPRVSALRMRVWFDGERRTGVLIYPVVLTHLDSLDHDPIQITVGSGRSKGPLARTYRAVRRFRQGSRAAPRCALAGSIARTRAGRAGGAGVVRYRRSAEAAHDSASRASRAQPHGVSRRTDGQCSGDDFADGCEPRLSSDEGLRNLL